MRRPSDIAMLGIASVLALLMGLWAQTQSTVNINLFRTFNDLSGNMEGLAKGIYALGSIWAVLAVTAVLLLARRRACVARCVGRGRSLEPRPLLNEILGTHDIHGLGVNVRIGDGPAYPVANVAAITALAFGIARLPRASPPSDLRLRHSPRCSRRDVPGRRLSGRRARRILPGRRGRRPCPSRVRCPRGKSVDRRGHIRAQRPRVRRHEHRPCGRAHRPRIGDGRRAGVGPAAESRRLRARPAGRPGCRQVVAQGDVPRSRVAGVRESAPTGGAHRLRVDARRARTRPARGPRCGQESGGPMPPRYSSPLRPTEHPSRRWRPSSITDEMLARLLGVGSSSSTMSTTWQPRRAPCARGRRRCVCVDDFTAVVATGSSTGATGTTPPSWR